MKTFPIKSALVIVLLLGCCFYLFHLILENREANKTTVIRIDRPEKKVQGEIVTTTFRFSKRPTHLAFIDLEGKIFYQTNEFDNNNEHIANITYPKNSNSFLELQLLVEWKTPAEAYHFFSMEIDNHEYAKFGASSPTDIIETIKLQW